MTQRERFVWVAEQHLGLPYIWGGDDPILGFDCSGLVVECGLSVGLFVAPFDTTSAGLFGYAVKLGGVIEKKDAKPGDLILYAHTNDRRKIHHVGILIGDGLMIEAGGGRSTTVDSTTAARQNAYVRVRPAVDRGMYTFYADLLSVGPVTN